MSPYGLCAHNSVWPWAIYYCVSMLFFPLVYYHVYNHFYPPIYPSFLSIIVVWDWCTNSCAFGHNHFSRRPQPVPAPISCLRATQCVVPPNRVLLLYYICNFRGIRLCRFSFHAYLYSSPLIHACICVVIAALINGYVARFQSHLRKKQEKLKKNGALGYFFTWYNSTWFVQVK